MTGYLNKHIHSAHTQKQIITHTDTDTQMPTHTHTHTYVYIPIEDKRFQTLNVFLSYEVLEVLHYSIKIILEYALT